VQRETAIHQDAQFIVAVAAMHFPPDAGSTPIEHPVTDSGGKRLFLVCLQVLQGISSMLGDDEDDVPRERLAIVTPDKQHALASCCVHSGLMGKYACRVFNGHGDLCGVLEEETGVALSGARTFAFHPNLSHPGSDFGNNVLTIRREKSLKQCILQGDRDVVANCEPMNSPHGAGVDFYSIACRGLADIGLSVLLTLGADRIVAREGSP
jgi:hypothetical protein